MQKKYLFFVSLPYSYSILRPLQEEIWKNGSEVKWYIEDKCPVLLSEHEKQLKTIPEVIAYNPIAVFAPGNYIYDFFPGVKVTVFHGYAMKKRIEKIDDHFTIRGWFDIYCTQGETCTPYYKILEKKHRFFKVYETGWCKVDSFFKKPMRTTPNPQPIILYSSTFTKDISSAAHLLPIITEMVKAKPWDWIISLHPKLSNPEIIGAYKKLVKDSPNVSFNEYGLVDPTLLDKADVLLCDSSSIIIEFLLFDKPAVTFRNTNPGNYLLNITNEKEIPAALEKAITRPKELMENIRGYTMTHEPYRDGKNSTRVLDAVDDFILNHKDKLKSKPLNLIRKIKLRLKAKYYHW